MNNTAPWDQGHDIMARKAALLTATGGPKPTSEGVETMNNLPSFESYANSFHSPHNVNALMFTDAKGVRYYFSYKTLVAFQIPGDPVVCRENDWGPTTGGHLNQIEPDKSRRVAGDVFEHMAAMI